MDDTIPVGISLDEFKKKMKDMAFSNVLDVSTGTQDVSLLGVNPDFLTESDQELYYVARILKDVSRKVTTEDDKDELIETRNDFFNRLDKATAEVAVMQDATADPVTTSEIYKASSAKESRTNFHKYLVNEISAPLQDAAQRIGLENLENNGEANEDTA